MNDEDQEKKFRRALREVAQSQEGQIVFDGIARFCREGIDAFTVSRDERSCSYILGRQSVMIMLNGFLNNGGNDNVPEQQPTSGRNE